MFKSNNYEDRGFMSKDELNQLLALCDKLYGFKNATEQDCQEYRNLKHKYDAWKREEKRKLRASALAKLGLTEEEWNALMDR